MIPFCQLHLRPAVLSIPSLSAWALAYSQGMCLSQISSLSTFTLAFILYENWKNAFCWCRSFVNGHETPWGRKTSVPVGVDVLFTWKSDSIFSFGPFKTPCTPFGHAKCSCEYLWMVICLTLSVCKLPTVNFIIALYGDAWFIFWSQSSFLV